MKNKRILAVVLALIFAMALIAGCTPEEQETTETNEPTESTTTESVEEAEVTAEETADPLEMYNPIEGKEYSFLLAPYIIVPIDQDGALITYFEGKYDVDFEIMNLDNSNYDQLIGLQFASGVIPDLIRNTDASNLKKWAQQGLLSEINIDVLERFAPISYKFSIDTSPNVFRIGMVDGKHYGLCSIPVGAGPQLRYTPALWRGDWLENLGITKIPETLEEYEDAFYKIALEDPDGNGENDTYGISRSGLCTIFGAYGMGSYNDNVWIEKDGKLVFTPIQPESKTVVEMLAKWYSDGVLDPEFITGENNGGYWAISHSFLNGRIGFTSHAGYYHWNPPIGDTISGGPVYLELEKLDSDAAQNLAYGLPAKGPDGIYGTFGGGQSNPVLGNLIACLGVNLEKEPDRMGKFLQVMDDINYGTKDNMFTMYNGIEGINWEYDENGYPVAIGEAAEDSNYVRRLGAAAFELFGPKNYYPDLEIVKPSVKAWAIDNGWTEGILKQGKLPSVVTEAEETYRTDLDKLISETYIDIITGEKPIEYFDTFVQMWYDQGGTEIEQEVNDWYTDFWAE